MTAGGRGIESGCEGGGMESNRKNYLLYYFYIEYPEGEKGGSVNRSHYREEDQKALFFSFDCDILSIRLERH